MSRPRELETASSAFIGRPERITPDAEGNFSPSAIAYLLSVLGNIIRKVNGFLSFGNGTDGSWAGNFDGQWRDVQFVAANTSTRFEHGLGRIPVGWLDNSYGGGIGIQATDAERASWTGTVIVLRAATTGRTRLLIF